MGHVHPEIYSHFSEHLGRCIYEGIYVGEESAIPNIHGIRKDVIEAFRNIKMPVLRWPVSINDIVAFAKISAEIADDVMKVTLPPCSIVEVSLQ